MKIIRDIAELPLDRKTALSIGNFDGIHAGHRRLVAELVEQSHRLDIPAVVVTFDPHPIEVLVPGQTVPRLTTIERKAELLGWCGVDYLVVLRADQDLLRLDYREFFRRYVVEAYQAHAVVEGPNFFFGRNREGNTDRLRELCREHGIALTIVEISQSSRGITSSTAIRQLIEAGNLLEANQLLVEPYQIAGRVIPGAARGREIGFPTANLGGIEVLLPGEGVYAGWTAHDGQAVPSAIHIGPNPTFGDDQRKVEVHLIDRKVDLYEDYLQVELVSRIRGIARFSSQDELVAQIQQDIRDIKSALSSGEG